METAVLITLLLDWVEFAVRWAHVIIGIAWIGSSFYFIALDLGLRNDRPLPDGVKGEEWQVHGGGFYHLQKYSVAPSHLPEHLTWFKWESYMTWISGFALLILVYYFSADLYLVDPEVLAIPAWAGILISLASITVGWIAYDRICTSRFGDDNTKLMLFLFAVLVLLGWLLTQVFTGRAAMLHLGAITATIMSANVAMVIIPNQKIVVADLKAGRTPDPKFGQIAKQRSTHNNYLTLPVLFLMLSNHYPLATNSQFNWLIAALVFLMGVTIRHFFNTMHATGGYARGKRLWWTWAATAGLFAGVIALSIAPIWLQRAAGEERTAIERPLSPSQQAFLDSDLFEEVHEVVLGRCTMCHAAEVYYPGIAVAPKGVELEVASDVARYAAEIYLQAGVTHAMPPANASYIEPQERALIRRWFEGG